MTTSHPTFTPVRSRRNILPALLVLIALAAIGGGLWIALTAQRTTFIAAWARPVAAGQIITDEDVTTMAVPVDRAPGLTGVADPAQLVGRWTTRAVGAGELVYPDQSSATAPGVPFYPNGESLPDGLVAVPFSLKTVGPVSDHDTINVGLIDRTGNPSRCVTMGGMPSQPAQSNPVEPMGGEVDPYSTLPAITCRLIPQVPILYVDQDAQIAFLAVTPYQSQVIYTLSAQSDAQLYGERYGSNAPALPYLTRMDPSQIDPVLLTGPVSATTPLLPGVWGGDAIPGAPSSGAEK